jgi:hypothetical protein
MWGLTCWAMRCRHCRWPWQGLLQPSQAACVVHTTFDVGYAAAASWPRAVWEGLPTLLEVMGEVVLAKPLGRKRKEGRARSPRIFMASANHDGLQHPASMQQDRLQDAAEAALLAGVAAPNNQRVV